MPRGVKGHRSGGDCVRRDVLERNRVQFAPTEVARHPQPREKSHAPIKPIVALGVQGTEFRVGLTGRKMIVQIILNFESALVLPAVMDRELIGYCHAVNRILRQMSFDRKRRSPAPSVQHRPPQCGTQNREQTNRSCLIGIKRKQRAHEQHSD